MDGLISLVFALIRCTPQLRFGGNKRAKRIGKTRISQSSLEGNGSDTDKGGPQEVKTGGEEGGGRD